MASHHGDAHEEQDEPCRDLQDTAETPEGLKARRQAVREERRQEEGHAEPERVDGEQGYAAGDGGGSGADCQDGAENRPDAGRPAEGEGKSQNIGREWPAAWDRCMKPTLPHERSEEHTSELQSLMRNSYAV